MKRILVAFVLGTTAALAGCSAAAVRPSGEGALLTNGSLAREVQRDAPAAWAAVLRVQREAESAPDELRALYRESVALELEVAAQSARAGRARARVDGAERTLHEAEQDLARVQSAVDSEQQALAEAAAGQHSRELAAERVPQSARPEVRDAVVAELLQRAGFYLESAALLGATPAQLAPARARLAAARTATVAMRFTSASQAYSAAESLLAATQRQAPANPALERGAMVEALSQTGGLEPRAEERGVVLVLRGLFVQGTARLVPSGRGRLAVVARVLQNYAPLEVRVEALAGGAAGARLATSQAEALVAELVRAGVPATRLHPAGAARVASGARSDDRVELVLLVPSAP